MYAWGKIALISVIAAGASLAALAEGVVTPDTVTFPSADQKTTLAGYVFRPPHAGTERLPAVVMMHGRGGAYSSLADGTYDATTLSKRHKFWGETLAREGYLAILVDGFGPRGYPHGFPQHSYGDRPPELDETTVRPLDAYGALAYLRTRPDVDPKAIGLLGWSNGGSATLAAMSADTPALPHASVETGFRGALAFYPACGLKGKFDDGYRPYAPVRVFIGAADEEVSPKRCEDLVEKSEMKGGDIKISVYPGATHDFDDPGRKRASVDANADAVSDAVPKALRFLGERLR
jgi:carboxymethylenebutenolidase